MLRLRLKGKTGTRTIQIKETLTLGDLYAAAAKDFGGVPSSVSLLLGFPPKKCTQPSGSILSSFIRSGETIIVNVSKAPSTVSPCSKTVANQGTIAKGDIVQYREREQAVVLRVHTDDSTSSYYTIRLQASGREIQTTQNHILLQQSMVRLEPFAEVEPRLNNSTPSQTSLLAHKDTWACGRCTLINALGVTRCGVCEMPRPSAASPPTSEASEHPKMKATRHNVLDDNSCLFHALSYLLEPSFSAPAMREAVAAAVRSSPQRWNAGTLGKEPAAYIRFILDPTKWGGQVEVAILAERLRSEVAVVDIQTGRTDVFGRGKNFGRRVYVLYTGIHFDPLLLDGRKAVRLAEISRADRAVAALAAELKTSKQYTDKQTMRLRCKTCGHIMHGDLQARMHAGSSGHTDFVQAAT